MIIDTRGWVKIGEKYGHICGTSQFHDETTSIQVCFQPHKTADYHSYEHTEIPSPFVGYKFMGRMNPEPFDPYEAVTKCVCVKCPVHD